MLESAKQLYYIFTTKQLFLEWLLEVNLFIGKKISKSLAVEEIDKFTKTNDSIDMRNISGRLKKILLYDENIINKRWDLCQGCEFLKNDKCEKCGCFMKVKTKIASARCPIGKWEKEDKFIPNQNLNVT